LEGNQGIQSTTTASAMGREPEAAPSEKERVQLESEGLKESQRKGVLTNKWTKVATFQNAPRWGTLNAVGGDEGLDRGRVQTVR